MPVTDIRSISQVGTYEPFELQVGRGQIPGHSVIHVFGHNPDVDTTEVTIWPATGLLTHPAAPTIMTISSSSASDTSAGTGARTAVNTVNQYDAIETMSVTSVGSGGVNAGTIYAGTGTVTAGVPAVPYSAIGIGDNLSLVGHWTCPAGYTGYLVSGSITSGTSNANQYITARLKLRAQDNIVRTAAITTLHDGTADYDFLYPIKIQAGECITATAKGSGSNNDVSSYFQIVLIKNGGPL